MNRTAGLALIAIATINLAVLIGQSAFNAGEWVGTD